MTNPTATLAQLALECAAARSAALLVLPIHELSLERASEYIGRWSDSYSRMQMVLALRPRMDHGEWLALLGDFWTTSDSVGDHFKELRRVLGTAGPLLPMMTLGEQAAHAALPDRMTIYRGCSQRYVIGSSWSLDENVARSFPRMLRYHVSDPMLVTATVAKKYVLALKLDRDEQEVITFMARKQQYQVIAKAREADR